jgi:uncharacterized protein YutE (UPF0331/DUF86 family)
MSTGGPNMSLDKAMIQGKIDIIERNLEFLAIYKQATEKDFIQSYKDIQAVKYSLLEIIEACIDLASHISVAGNFERAESYAEIFEILAKQKILPSQLAEKLADMARFRNLLVHSYGKVDNARVLEFVKTELNDITRFIERILKHVENR